MGHRLTRIYTRTGDDGTTGLATGERVPKDDPRIEANGNVDETSSAIALILAESDVPPPVRDSLLRIQNELFDVGAEFALPGYVGIASDAVARIERDLDALNADLPPLKDFILPGGPRAAAACHLARAVCRRAERSAWTLARDTELNPETLRYLNRLSDLLFVVARYVTLRTGGSETLWTKRAAQQAQD